MTKSSAYENLPLEALLMKEKEAKRLRILFVVMAVGTTAATLYAIAAVKHTGFLHPASILFSLFMLTRNGMTLKQIQAEIKERAAP
jgi:hypothetical protein